MKLSIGATREIFNYSLWASLSQDDFNRALQLWNDPQRISEPSYEGQIANQLTGYPDTLGLKAAIHSRKVGFRPLIRLNPSLHPLASEQLQGIEMRRVQEVAELMFHRNDE